jgi:hypothetical protein
MLMAYQLKHERMLQGGEAKKKRVMKLWLWRCQRDQQNGKVNFDDLLNFQLREIQFILCTFFQLHKILSPTAGRQRRKKNCQLTQLDGSIAK